MSPQEQDAKMLDNTDNVPHATQGINALPSFGDPDDIEYSNQYSALFQGLFDPPEPEIGHFLDALDDDRDVSQFKQPTEPLSFRSRHDSNLSSVTLSPLPVTNDNPTNHSSELLQPRLDPLAVNSNNLFVSPNELSLETTTGQLEYPGGNLPIDLSFAQFVPHVYSGFEYDSGFSSATTNATGQNAASQNMDVDSFENLMMVFHMK